MQRPPNKISHTIFLFAILLLIPLAIMVHYQEPQEELVSKEKNLCYLGADIYIEALLLEDHAASGVLDFTPLKKDALTGTFIGSWRGEGQRILTINHTYEGQGATGNAERSLILYDEYAKIDWDSGGPGNISSLRIPRISCDVIL